MADIRRIRDQAFGHVPPRAPVSLRATFHGHADQAPLARYGEAASTEIWPPPPR